MGLRFPEQKHCNCFFVTTSFKDWYPFGNIPGFYSALARSLIFCAEKYETLISGYVLMPTHIHLLVFIDGEKLPGFMRDFKKFIAQKVIKDFGVNVSNVWTPRYDRVAIYTEAVFRTKLNYIHQNPVKDGLVENSEDWEWSSAKDYFTDIDGRVPIWKGWGP